MFPGNFYACNRICSDVCETEKLPKERKYLFWQKENDQRENENDIETNLIGEQNELWLKEMRVYVGVGAENSLFSNTSRSCMCFDSLGYSLWSLFILQIQLVNTAGGISVKWNIKFIKKENFKSHSRSDSYPALSIRWKFPDCTMRERENETKQSRNVSTLEIASVQQRQQAKSCD